MIFDGMCLAKQKGDGFKEIFSARCSATHYKTITACSAVRPRNAGYYFGSRYRPSIKSQACSFESAYDWMAV
jgi:hypothetical protein